MSASLFTPSSDQAHGRLGDLVPRRAAKRHGLVLAVSVLAVLQVIAAINIAVDPFGFFGVNQVGYYFNSEREFKQQQIRIYPHRALLLGNSKMAYIDPDDLPELGFFNAAFSGASPSEMLTFLEAHIDGVELVALALDHRMFLDYETKTLDLQEPTWTDWLRYSLSLELLGKSFEALSLYRRGAPSYYKPNGVRTTWELEIRDYLTDGIAYWERLSLRRQEYQRRFPVFPPQRIDTFRKIKGLLDEHGVSHVVYMNPLNTHEHEVIDWQDKWQSSQSYKDLVATLREIFPEFRDYSDSVYSDPASYWPTDFKHYRPEIGAKIIREMIASKDHEPLAAIARIQSLLADAGLR